MVFLYFFEVIKILDEGWKVKEKLTTPAAKPIAMESMEVADDWLKRC